jgi:hypothetical protein
MDYAMAINGLNSKVGAARFKTAMASHEGAYADLVGADKGFNESRHF